MFGLKGFVRHAFVWLAASMVPIQPLWAISCCMAGPHQQAAGPRCHGSPCHMEKGAGCPAGKCPEGCMAMDTTPAPEEPQGRLGRRKSEVERQDDPYGTIAIGTVTFGPSAIRAHVRGPVHPVAASEHCVILCRMLL